MESTSEHRHQLIHGFALNVDAFERTGLSPTLRTVREKGERLTRHRATYSIRDLDALFARALTLTVVLGKAAEILSGEAGSEDDAYDALSKLLIDLR
jgi:hypothetical protein